MLLLLLGLAGVLTSLSIAAFGFRGVGLFSDAEWYASAMPALVGDAPLYPPEWLRPHIAELPARFNQPPSAALLAPLAVLTPVWGALMTGSMIMALRLVWPRLRYPFGLLLLCVVLAWWPTHAAFWWANANSLALLCLAVAVRWPRWAGWAMGVAIAAKLAPLFWIGWLVRRDGWRAAGPAILVPVLATALVVALTGPNALWEFVVVRLNEVHPDASLRVGLPLTVGVPLAAVLGVLAWLRGSLTLAILASLAVVPALHLHYWVFLLVPLLLWGRLVPTTPPVRALPDRT